MSNVIEYKEIMAFHPGYYVQELVEDMEISQAEFATRIGTTAKTLSKLINGQANITNDLANKLSLMTGISLTTWQNLQNTYDQKIIEIKQEEDLEKQKEIAELIDYSYFVKNVGLPDTKKINERIINLCRFFKIYDLRLMLRPDLLVNYRSSNNNKDIKNIVNSGAWLQTALNVAESITTKPFNASKLKAFLPELRSMTLQEPKEFYPRMKNIFSECGIALVILPHLKNSGVNGAVKWINEDRVVLAMNNRGLNADIFWFSLFHEIKHVLQQKIKTVFISGSDEEKIAINEKLEIEADRFARNYLIPQNDYKKFAPTKYTSDKEIIDFANSIGIHPGIVAGRLQHDHIIAPNRCGRLKQKYEIVN